MIREDKLKIYDALVAQCPRFKRLGKTMPYTSSNGYMFSLFNKDNEIGIRFSKDTQESYFKKFNTTLYHSYGAVMRGYILIPEHMWTDVKTIIKLLNESYDYVMTLKPK